MKTVLITGANRGLGLGLAQLYREAGWKVWACCRDPQQAGALSELVHPDRLEIFQLDVESASSVAKLAQRLSGRPLDVLLNVAGYFGPIPLDQPGGVALFGGSDFDDWEKQFRVNVMGVMRLAEALVENVAMGEERKIVAISSSQGSISNSFGKLYGYRASKAGLNAIMKAMAIDLEDRGIATLCLHPGWVRTAMGGADATVDIADAATGIIARIEELSTENSGSFKDYQGNGIAW